MGRIPKMQRQKSSNLAKVRLRQPEGSIKDVYLGPWGSDEAQQRYDELIACFLVSSRNLDSVTVTIHRFCIVYLEHAATYYGKNRKITSEVSTIRAALRELVAECGRVPLNDFGPNRLKAVCDRMISKGWVRNYCACPDRVLKRAI